MESIEFNYRSNGRLGLVVIAGEWSADCPAKVVVADEASLPDWPFAELFDVPPEVAGNKGDLWHYLRAFLTPRPERLTFLRIWSNAELPPVADKRS